MSHDDRGEVGRFALKHVNPFTTPEALAGAIEAAGGRYRFGLERGIHHNVLVRWERELGVFRPNDSQAPVENADVLEAIRKARGGLTVEQLADGLDISPRRVREALSALRDDGYRVAESGVEVTLDKVAPAPADQIHRALFDGEDIRFAVISDTHLGSNEERLAELHLAYDLIHEEGIDKVFHPGDLVCGKGIYGTQVRDVHKHTFDAQVDYAIANYPSRPGIETLIISGNHDLEGDFGRQGADPVRAVANRRHDMTYMGEYSAFVELPNNAYVHILHPGGGASYALSYKPQKLCEAYESGRKPAILLIGHYHRHGHFASRNIETFLCGTFEGSTNLAKRYGMGQPSVGFWIIEARLAEDASLVRLKSEWFSFYVGRSVKAA